MEEISWGIIGCGDVTEVKSGPAFNKVPNSSLKAVMRRDKDKAADYAARHHVPTWYSNAQELINDPTINAIYVATPPSFHEEYCLAALQAGKSVYVEKPMTTDTASAKRMKEMVTVMNGKLCVAHYRRAQPLFSKLKELLDQKTIGDIRIIQLEMYKKLLTHQEMDIPKTAWRVNTAIAGGGLFHDLSPHQLDLMLYFFGSPVKVQGLSTNQAGRYAADDVVSGQLLFQSGAIFNGVWCFTVNEESEKDHCEIIGSTGSIRFSFFDHAPITVTTLDGVETYAFEPLQHVQQPMIEKVTNYFLRQTPNPCTVDDGLAVMEIIEKFTRH